MPTRPKEIIGGFTRNSPVIRPTFVVKTQNPPEPEKSYPSQHSNVLYVCPCLCVFVMKLARCVVTEPLVAELSLLAYFKC